MNSHFALFAKRTNHKNFYILSLVLCLFALSYILYKNTITSEPSFIHAWAQTDRYALALGFLNNNFDFFHPQTYTLDLQFPAIHELKVKQGITRVDFPIHEYIIALIMKLTGSSSPFIFRAYILLYSWVGLIFLALFTQRLSGSRIKGAFVMIFAFTAPVFTYYQAGFFPTIPSIAETVIALYFYLLYKTEKRSSSLYLSALFFTLSALSRTPFLIFVIAFCGQQVLTWIADRKLNTKEFIVFVLSFATIGSYFLYNQYLGNKYGSIFLSHPLPAENFGAFISLLVDSWYRWKFDYFSQYHYVILASLVLITIATSVKKLLPLRSLLGLLGLIMLGEIMYGILMIHQFVDHDYYFLDTFFIPTLLLLILAISPISVKGHSKIVFVSSLVIFSILFLLKTDTIQTGRYTYYEGDVTEMTRRNFDGAELFLDSLNVPKAAPLMVLGAYSYNIPFVKMNRKGYAVVRITPETIEKSLKEKADFIIIQDEILVSRIIAAYPSIVNQLEKIKGNGKITLYKKKNRLTSIEDFIGLSDKDKIKEALFDFDTTTDSLHWSNGKTSNYVAYSGHYSGKTPTDSEFGLAYTDTITTTMKGARIYITFETFFEKPIGEDIMLVVAVENASGRLFYSSTELTKSIPYKQWKKQLFEVFLPPTIHSGDVLKICLWNPFKEEFYYDDFKISIYNHSK